MPKKSRLVLLFLLTGTLSVPGFSRAETHTVSWYAVMTYTDGTPIEPTRIITYDFFWTTDAGLSPASLRTVASSVSQTSATFDPDVLGMPRGQTVYFTGEAVLNTGEKSAFAPPYSWTVPIVSPPPAHTLSSLAISGPASMNEGGSGSYTATATWSDGTTSNVTSLATWTTTLGTINAGVLMAPSVTANQTATVSASYASGGVTRSAALSVTIVEATGFTLAVPQNVEVAGPVSTSPDKQFLLKWDPVTTRADGTPVTEGSVSYDAYWTTDSVLSAVNLHPLASSSSTTSVNFNPNSAGMPKNQRVYFTAKAKSTAGELSPLAPAVSWVANNQGPSAPRNPKIHKK